MKESPIGNRKPLLGFIRGRDALETYCNEIKRYRTLTFAEERALGIGIKAGNKRALKVLIQSNLKFVVAVCRNYAGRGLPLSDLINEGNLGLIRAAHRFDGTRNFKFISYAVWWIRQGILSALAEQTRPLAVTTSWVGTHRALAAAARKLEQDLERPPSAEELGEETGIGVAAIIRHNQVAASALSLNRPLHAEGGRDFVEGLEDKHAERPDAEASRHFLGKRVKEMIGTLGEREQLILRQYFGIGCDSESNLSEIGRRLQLTRERVRQIKAKALRRLTRLAEKAVS